MVENKKKREKSGRMRRPLEQLEQIIIISRVALVVKNPPADAEDIRYLGLIPRGGNGNQPTPVFLPGESHGQRRLAGYSPVQFSRSVMSDSLWPHGLQHTRLPCPSPIPEACSNSCPSSHWYHPTISSSVVPFSCLQSFPASGSFLMNQFFTSGGQSIEVSALASLFPMTIQDWFPLGLTCLIFLQSKGLSRVFSNTNYPTLQFFGTQLSSQSKSHIHIWLLEKPSLWMNLCQQSNISGF